MRSVGTVQRVSDDDAPVTPPDVPVPVVAVANRLPVQLGDDGWQLAPGGLVTALRPVMERRSGTWVGWDGGSGATPKHLPSLSIDLGSVQLEAADVDRYYHGFANRTLWPLLHNAVEKPVFDREWWACYRDVNARFAAATIEAAAAHDDPIIWVHDYHLMLVPQLVRAELPDVQIGFFLHVPWPSPDIFVRLPWRREILLGLLGADVVSFHTERYRSNFVRACRRVLGEAADFRGGGDIVVGDRVVRTTAAPISVDAGELTALARSKAVDEEVRALEQQFEGRTVLLGVDRLDYTKGIIERLLAVELLLERDESLRDRLVMVQIAVPSRDDVQEYRDLRATVEQIVGRINGRFTLPGADVPVHYLYRGLDQPALAAYYAMADALLVTPLIDGMNLVAKEYVVVQHARRGDGVLVLSEFTGAALELKDAVLCNPFDVEGLSYQIERALALDKADRQRRLSSMARRVRAHDVHRWVAGQLAPLVPTAAP